MAPCYWRTIVFARDRSGETQSGSARHSSSLWWSVPSIIGDIGRSDSAIFHYLIELLLELFLGAGTVALGKAATCNASIQYRLPAASLQMPLPASGLGRAVGNGPDAWDFDIHVRYLEEASGCGLAESWLLCSTREWTNKWGNLSVSRFPSTSLCNSFKRIHKSLTNHNWAEEEKGEDLVSNIWCIRKPQLAELSWLIVCSKFW